MTAEERRAGLLSTLAMNRCSNACKALWEIHRVASAEHTRYKCGECDDHILALCAAEATDVLDSMTACRHQLIRLGCCTQELLAHLHGWIISSRALSDDITRMQSEAARLELERAQVKDGE